METYEDLLAEMAHWPPSLLHNAMQVVEENTFAGLVDPDYVLFANAVNKTLRMREIVRKVTA